MAVAAQFFYVAAQAGIFSFFINYMTAEVPADSGLLGCGADELAAHAGSCTTGCTAGSKPIRRACSPSATRARRTWRRWASSASWSGRFTGAGLLRKYSAHKMLGLYGADERRDDASWSFCKLGWLSVVCVFLSYFFMSIMFPTIFALGIFGLGARAKKASAFIVMAIMGGAILPKLMGYVADQYDMSRGFIVPDVLLRLRGVLRLQLAASSARRNRCRVRPASQATEPARPLQWRQVYGVFLCLLRVLKPSLSKFCRKRPPCFVSTVFARLLKPAADTQPAAPRRPISRRRCFSPSCASTRAIRTTARPTFSCLSKGHAAPLLYAAWAEAGAFPREKLLTLRRIDSDLEGHPTPRLPFVDVATGSLGQGLSAAAGIALHARQFAHSDQRVYVLIGDGESAEGSVWEAAQWASLHGLGNLCATIDINRLGQSEPTMLEYHLETYQRRWEAFGWQALTVDGHNIPELLAAYRTALATTDRPTVVLARTVKGKGLPGIEGKEHWHGKPLDRDTAAKVIAELEKNVKGAYAAWEPKLPPSPPAAARAAEPGAAATAKPPYAIGRQGDGHPQGFRRRARALATSDARVVAVDGDVKNSTYTEEFQKAAPDRFFQGYIAEQNMLGTAMGLAARGNVPFVATFACFLTRAFDFIRMAAISNLNHQARRHARRRLDRRGRPVADGSRRSGHDVRRTEHHRALPR